MLNRHKQLTVLHVATLNQPIRPDLGYSPIETVIYNLDKGLHLLGHRSIVACSGDSRVVGEHYVTVDKSIGEHWSDTTPPLRQNMHTHLSKALYRIKKGDIDIIHTHDVQAVEFLYDVASRMRIPIVMTIHVGVQESPFKEAPHQRWCNPKLTPPVYYVAISEYQKKQYKEQLSKANVIHHGIEVEQFPVKDRPDKGSYLFTIGRITPVKGQDKAVEAAKKTGSKLIIAGCVQNKAADRDFFANLKDSIDVSVEVGKYPLDNDYYEKVIRPLLDSDYQIIYIGEISSEHKKHWYRHARATLFPIQWGEPFGLVMIESMACGTPVIAFNRGAVPEIIVDGKTGFVVDSMNTMAAAVRRIDFIDPRECRSHVQKHFSVMNMARKYSALYQQAISDLKNIRRRELPVNRKPLPSLTTTIR